jgi:hypothetical protein
MELAPEYGVTISNEAAIIAADAKATVKAANTKWPTLQSPLNKHQFNYLTGY